MDRWEPRTGWRRLGLAGLVLLVAAAGGLYAAPPDLYRLPDLKALENTFADLADRTKASVVALRTYRYVALSPNSTEPARAKTPQSFGSGVIIRSEGLILTNQHVIEGAEAIKVVLHKGHEYDGQVVQVDVRSDLAVLRIDAKALRAAPFGDSANLRVGHWCFAVGNPFGIAYRDLGKAAVTFGNVAALGRSLTSELDGTDTRYYGDLIETSSPINPGNSGGPLFDIDGQVIGIVTAIVSRSGVTEGAGFAIPVCERTRRIIDTLLAGEPVRYGYLGVEVSNPPLAVSSTGEPAIRGAVIRSISEDNGPAAQAQLQPNDVIVEFAGVAIANADELVRVVGMTPVNAQTKVRYLRDGNPGETLVTLAERPQPRQPLEVAADSDIRTVLWQGAVLAEMNDATLQVHRLQRADAGLVVTRVEPGTPAQRAGLKPQDVILKCNGTRVRDLAEFAAVEATNARRIRLELMGGKSVRLNR